jgi:hypothetical protein
MGDDVALDEVEVAEALSPVRRCLSTGPVGDENLCQDSDDDEDGFAR